MTIHQISVFLENRAGQLAEITGLLSENHIDLRALNIAETADYGVLRIIVDQPEAAENLFRGHISGLLDPASVEPENRHCSPHLPM